MECEGSACVYTLCMLLCMHKCMYIHVTYVCINRVYVRVYVRGYLCVCVCVCGCTCIYVWMCVCTSCEPLAEASPSIAPVAARISILVRGVPSNTT